MKKKSVTLLGFVMILMLSMSLSACGSSGGSDDSASSGGGTDSTGTSSGGSTGSGTELSGKITFLTNRTDMIGKEYDDYVKRFNEKYPNIKVEFEGSQTDYNQQAKVRMAGDELPDVMFIPTIPNSDLPKYFAPLDDLGLDDKITFKDFRSYEGKVYGITTGNSTSGIVYNKKAFADAGITEIPKTWDEFLAACEKLKQKGIVPLASNFKDKWPLNNWVYDLPRLIENNADFPNTKLNTDTPFTMDNGYGKAFSLIRELNEKATWRRTSTPPTGSSPRRMWPPASSPCTSLATGSSIKSSEQERLRTTSASSRCRMTTPARCAPPLALTSSMQYPKTAKTLMLPKLS